MSQINNLTVKLEELGKEEETNATFSRRLRKFCLSFNDIKKQSMEWEKTFANYIMGRGIIFKILKAHITQYLKTIQLKMSRQPE